MIEFIEWVKCLTLSAIALSIGSIFFALICWAIINLFKKIEAEHFKKELKLKIGGPNRNRFRDKSSMRKTK